MSPRCTLCVVVPVRRHRVDEGLVVPILFAAGYKRRLPVCLAGELGGGYVWNPRSGSAATLLAQTGTVLSDSIASRCHNFPLHVTRSAFDLMKSRRPRAQRLIGLPLRPNSAAMDVDTSSAAVAITCLVGATAAEFVW